jgi:hypothetical protein
MHPGVSAMPPAATVQWWSGAGAVESARHLARFQLKARRGQPDINRALHIEWTTVDGADDVYQLGVDDGLGVMDATWSLQVNTAVVSLPVFHPVRRSVQAEEAVGVGDV